MKPEGIYEFGQFRIEALARTLWREEEIVTLNRRAFDVLLYFVRNPGRVLTRDELLKNVWPDTFVDENSLAQSISVLRRALEEKPGDNSYIVTLPGRGYQFVSQVQVIAPENLAVLPDAATPAIHGPSGLLFQQQTIRTSVVTEEKQQLSLPGPRPRAGGEADRGLSRSCDRGCRNLCVEAVSPNPAGDESSCREFDWVTAYGAPFRRRSRFSQPVWPFRRRLDLNGLGGNVKHRTGGRRKAAPGFRRRHRAHQTRSSLSRRRQPLQRHAGTLAQGP
jgi:DNA-binding winged helix-turn-helix (wHTH) protein